MGSKLKAFMPASVLTLSACGPSTVAEFIAVVLWVFFVVFIMATLDAWGENN